MKKLLFLILGLVVAGIGIALYLWNMPHKTVDGTKGRKVTAEVLSKAFETDEAAANSVYLNSILSVSGTVTEVSANQEGNTVLLLDGGGALGGVQCTMKAVYDIQPGQKMTIKGFCNGYTLVVLLSECVVE